MINPQELHYRIFKMVRSVIDRITFSSKNRHFEMEGEKLYPSEIHLLLFIGQGPDFAKNATRIAESMEITKGAVSQNISRLVRKGVLQKHTDGYRKNELNIAFTSKGERILEACRNLENSFLAAHDSLLEGFSEDQKESLLVFLERLLKII